jgi:hypothetical protein
VVWSWSKDSKDKAQKNQKRSNLVYQNGEKPTFIGPFWLRKPGEIHRALNEDDIAIADTCAGFVAMACHG